MTDDESAETRRNGTEVAEVDRDIEFESHIGPPDHFRVLVVLSLRNPMVLALLTIGPLLLAAGALTGDLGILYAGTVLTPSALAALICGLVGAVFISRWRTWRSAYQPLHVRAGEDGIELAGSDDARTVRWDDTRRWRVVAGLYVLETEDAGFIALRRDAVPPERRLDFEDLLRRYVPRGPRPPKDPAYRYR